jgi:DNA-binding protein H-NS
MEIHMVGTAHPEMEAPSLRGELRASALRQARWLMDFYRITPEDLLAPSDPLGQAAQTTHAAEPLPVKYRHPVTGETWDGSGSHPQWMRQALLQDGYRVEELRVSPAQEDSHARTAA